MPTMDVYNTGTLYNSEELSSLLKALKEIVPSNWILGKGTAMPDIVTTPGYVYYIIFQVPSDQRSVVPGHRIQRRIYESSHSDWAPIAKVPLEDLPKLLNKNFTQLQSIAFKARLLTGI